MEDIAKVDLALYANYSTHCNSLHSMQLISKATLALCATHSKATFALSATQSQSMQLITFNSFDSIKLIPIPKATLALITTHCIQCNSLH